MKALMGFWHLRQPRERLFLAAAVSVLISVLVYSLLVDPALNARQRLQRSLPALRQQANELDALLSRAAALPAPIEQSFTPLSRDAIQDSLKHKSVTAGNIVVGNDFITIDFETVSFSGLLDWLNDVQKTAHWQVKEANVKAQPVAGMVKASVTLRQP